MRLASTEADFAALKRYLSKRRFPVVGIRIQHSRYADQLNAKKPRQFAYTQEGSTVIYCSAAMEELPPQARLGVLIHECGHVIQQAFSDFAEIEVDDFVVSMIPESGYKYKDAYYLGLDGRIRLAKAIEHVSIKFATRIYK